MLNAKTIARLSVYRRLLTELRGERVETVYSHQLAALAGATAAQVRRDVMNVGYQGSPTRGYAVEGLLERIAGVLDAPEGQRAALVGVGNLGRAILTYFAGRRPNLRIAAAFDVDPEKVSRVLHGHRCHSIAELEDVVRSLGIDVGIITVPAGEAQRVADALMQAGVRGLLNFAPVRLRVPPDVHAENVDISVLLEKVAFFARHGSSQKETTRWLP